MPPVRRVSSAIKTINSVSPVKSYGTARDLRDFLQETFRHQSSRISATDLRRVSKSIVVRRAIRRIGNGVLSMPWRILPPEDLIRDPDAIAQAKRLRNALKQPNREEHGLYSKFIHAIIHEIVTIGVAAVERQLGDLADTESQAFWLFLANANNIQLNQSWSPQVAGIEPRFFDYGGGGSRQLGGMPIFAADMFLIQTEANAYELVPPSPLEIAYHMIQSWLGLGEFQTTTTSQAVREYILVLKGANQEDVDAFRAYWESEVEGSGKIPILGGEGVQVEKLGARNDD